MLANRTVSCASRLFSLALKPIAGENKPWRDQAQGNPCRGIERNQETAKEKFLSPAEIAAVVEGFDACGHTTAADCLRLILLMGPGRRRCPPPGRSLICSRGSDQACLFLHQTA